MTFSVRLTGFDSLTILELYGATLRQSIINNLFLFIGSLYLDPLVEMIGLLHPQAPLWKTVTGSGSWGLSFPKTSGASFCLVMEGKACIDFQDGENLSLERGDYVLMPQAGPYELLSELGAPSIRAEAALRDNVRLGGDTADPSRIVGGHFQFDAANSDLVLALLPRFTLVRASDEGALRLRRLVEVIDDEAQASRQGRGLVLSHLLAVMLVEALRQRDFTGQLRPKGLLGGLADRRLSAALTNVHGDITKDWTVAGLAASVGMSRAAFARRFKDAVGVAPMEYLLSWRLALAKDALIHSEKSIAQIAEAIGYKSASAFSTAFSREVGFPPAQYAKTRATTKKRA